MKLLILPTLLIFPSLALAEFREKERHRPYCDQHGVNHCVERNRATAEIWRGMLASIEPNLLALTSQLTMLEKNINILFREKNSFAGELGLLRSELEFLRPSTTSESTKILASQVSFENYFGLHLLHADWREHYPAERAEKLTAILAESMKKESDTAAHLERATVEKIKRDSEFQSLLIQKNSWLAEVRDCDARINGGCYQSLCPSDF